MEIEGPVVSMWVRGLTGVIEYESDLKLPRVVDHASDPPEVERLHRPEYTIAEAHSAPAKNG